MSIIEAIDQLIIEAKQLREKVATESAAKDHGAETATKADAKSSEKRFVMVRKIADGIYEISEISEDDLNGLKAAAEEMAAREEQISRRRRMATESLFAPFTQKGYIGMMDFLTCLGRPDGNGYIDFMDFLRSAQADQGKNNDKS